MQGRVRCGTQNGWESDEDGNSAGEWGRRGEMGTVSPPTAVCRQLKDGRAEYARGTRHADWL